MSSLPFSSPESERKAFEEAMVALAPDMTLLMHGSGDVPPSQVNADTTTLLTELTVRYISQLVDAAVDAHDLLTDGAGGVLPPPALENRRKPSRPPPFSTEKDKKKRKPNADYWDEPLPEPKIKSETSTSSTLPSSGAENATSVHVDEWVGVAGVDLWETSRSRKAYVTTPSAIGTQCFIFPICHDAGLYGRVMEVQAARRSIAPELMDTVWLDMVNAEGGRLATKTRKRPPSASSNDRDTTEEAADEEEDNNEEEDALPTWPGLESLLPTHQGE